MDGYTKLTLEIQFPTEPFPTKYSIETSDSCLDVFAFIDNMVAPLMVATGYAQQNIDEALGRDGDE